MTRRAAKSEPSQPASPGAFLNDGGWNPAAELRYRGETDRFVRALGGERQLARLPPPPAPCPNPSGDRPIPRQFGAVGPHREYLPPAGLEVRVMSLCPGVDGETL